MEEKSDFLQNQLLQKLSLLKGDETGIWGVLNAQQMVEHLSDAFRNYHGFDSKIMVTPAEHLEKMRAFMMSEKPFRPNTKNVEMPEVPRPCRNPDYASALIDLQKSIKEFFNYFDSDNNRNMINIFFGELDYHQSIQLLHKHACHHLKQFNLAD